MLPNHMRLTDPATQATFKRALRLATFVPAGVLVAALLAAALFFNAGDGTHSADVRRHAPAVGEKPAGATSDARPQTAPMPAVRPAG